MGNRTRRAVVVAAALALVGWMGVSPADAGGAPIDVSPSVVSPGDDFTVSGAGDCLDYGFTVSVPAFGLDADVSGLADEAWSTTFTVPAGTAPGSYEVVADYQGECISFNVGFVDVEVAQSISLSKTVGTAPDTCATTSSLSVELGTTVYYCYTVTNNTLHTLTTHTLTDDKLGQLLAEAARDLAPGASVSTVDLGVTASATPTAAVTNTATWIASLPEPPTRAFSFTASASATVTVTAPIDDDNPPPDDAPPAKPVVATPTVTG